MAEETPRLYLTDVHLKGYKSIKDTQATFNEGINIIIGPNGSGKTNFLEYLEKVLHNKIVIDAVNGENSITYFIKLETIQYHVTGLVNYTLLQPYFPEDEQIGLGDKKEIFSISNAEYHINGKEVFKVTDKTYRSPGDLNDRVRFAIDDQLKSDVDAELLYFIDLSVDNYLLSYLKYQLPDDYENISKTNTLSFGFRANGRSRYTPNKVEFAHPLVKLISSLPVDSSDELSNEQLVDYIFNSYHNTYFDKYQEMIALYTPIQNTRVSRLMHLTKEKESLVVNFLIFEFQIDGKWYLWNQLSDGTKRTFYIVFSILNAEVGPILLEEPELGLYPDQLQKLLTFIKEQSSRLQFIITTHSPDVMDILGIDELDKINICEMKGEEGTKIRKMTDEERKAVKAYHEEFGVLSDYWRYENFGLTK